MDKRDFQDLIVILKEKKAPALARFKAIAAEYEELKLYLEKIDNMLEQCGDVEPVVEVEPQPEQEPDVEEQPQVEVNDGAVIY